MRIVQYKLESEDHASYLKQYKNTRFTWIALSFLTLVAMGLEIAWDILIEHNNHDKNKMPKYLLGISFSCLSIQFAVYTMLIY